MANLTAGDGVCAVPTPVSETSARMRIDSLLKFNAHPLLPVDKRPRTIAGDVRNQGDALQ